jgi:hypothetical protein
MSATSEWDFTVPGDDSEPAADLPPFFNSFDGPADLAERSNDMLEAEFPGKR